MCPVFYHTIGCFIVGFLLRMGLCRGFDYSSTQLDWQQEDLWQAAFLVGTENTFEEGGELYGKKVYLFGCTKPQLVFFKNGGKVICIPVVVAVSSLIGVIFCVTSLKLI